jgi:hypothetical protein
VRRRGWSALAVAAVAIAAAAGVLLISGSGGDDHERAAKSGPRPAAIAGDESQPPGPARRQARGGGSTQHQVRAAVSQSRPARLDPAQRRVARVVRAYVAALDSHDGARACRLFAPGALSEVSFPRDRSRCASSLSASIGYRDPRGYPVYSASRIARVTRVAIDGPDARVTATTVTRFADQREPSVEDDVIYLRRADGRWLIAKPSVALYRAIGVGVIPPQALAPP